MRRHAIAGFVVIGIGLLGSPVILAGQQTEQARRVADGRQLFQNFCAPCHGRDAKGNGPAAAALKTAPPDLTAIASRNGGTFPREKIARLVADGGPSPAHGSREMPIWGPNFVALSPGSDKLVNPRVDDVVWYLSSIQAKVTKP